MAQYSTLNNTSSGFKMRGCSISLYTRPASGLTFINAFMPACSLSQNRNNLVFGRRLIGRIDQLHRLQIVLARVFRGLTRAQGTQKITVQRYHASVVDVVGRICPGITWSRITVDQCAFIGSEMNPKIRPQFERAFGALEEECRFGEMLALGLGHKGEFYITD